MTFLHRLSIITIKKIDKRKAVIVLKKACIKKSIKILFIIVPVIVVISLLCIFSSDKTTNGIDSIKDYEAVFQDVDELKFYIGDNNFYSTESPDSNLKTIDKVEINAEPMSKDRSNDRPFEHKIIINNDYIIYINNNFTELWLDDTKNLKINYNGNSWDNEVEEGILPSFSYAIENPEILKDLFQQYSQHLNQ